MKRKIERKYHLLKERERERERGNKITSVREEERTDLRTLGLGLKRKVTFQLLGGKQWRPVRGNDGCRSVQGCINGIRKALIFLMVEISQRNSGV